MSKRSRRLVKLVRMTIKTSKIDWDTDGDKEVFNKLPQRVILQADDEDGIADELSEMYGWCVLGLDFEIIR